MNVTTFPIFEVIALFGILIGPAIAYYAAKRKIGAEVLLINIDTIKGWSEARKAFEAEIADLYKKLKDSRKACSLEIAELHEKLIEERDRRRLERKRYLKQIAILEEELRVVLQLLDSTKTKNDIDE